MNGSSTTSNLTKAKLSIDMAIFLGFLIAMDPHVTGIALHEWLTVASLAAILTHLLLSWKWIVNATLRFFRQVKNRTRLNYILSLLMFIDGTLIMLTGIMISREVLPFLGISMPRNFFWSNLHSITADLFVFLLGLHVALHWNWIIDTAKRYILQPFARLCSIKQAEKKDVQA